MQRVPILQRGSEGNPIQEKLEFLVQHLPRKPIIGEPRGRLNGAVNQYLIIVHAGARLVEQIIVNGPESIGRIYLERYPTAQFLPNLDPEPYKRLSAYMEASRSKPKDS
ncbi:MAG: hypothetical protein Q8R18_02215 [bacterium]|nr:hypothetical protein [bacterium]